MTVSIWWLVAAFYAGALFMLTVIGLCQARARADRDLPHHTRQEATQ